MTNPLPQPGPADSRPADSPVTGTAEVSSTPARKAPRRASAPAGSPRRTEVPALMVVDDCGAVLPNGSPAHPTAHDAGGPAAAESSPAAEVGEAEAEPEPSIDAPEPLPQPTHMISTVAAPVVWEPAVFAGETDPTPQSRRERRMAEQKHGAAAITAAAPTPVALEAAAVEIVEPTPRTAQSPVAMPVKKRNRLVGALRGLLFLLVIAALVVALGTVRSGKDDPTAGPSQTEAHRQAAWENTSTLLKQTEEVRSGGEDPKLMQLLADVGEDLEIQLAALGNGLPPATATASAPAGTAVPASVEQVVAGLQTNGTELLDNAVNADHAMGRVFAAVGTKQLLQGRALGAAADMTPQDTSWLPTTVDFPAPAGPECNSTLEPRPGASVDAALLAAAQGEQKAVYAYEVATPRLADPQIGRAEQLLAGHQEKLALLNSELQVRCLPRIVPAPGFALNPEFISAPSSALAGLEGQLAASYADLAALSTAPVSANADLVPGPVASSGTTPGTAATAENTSMLRQMSVTWLLDSAASQLTWGGVPAPLPGLICSEACQGEVVSGS